MMEDCTPATVLTGGRSLVSSPPAFSSDGKKLLICTGSTVSVFSSSTGMLVAELEGHTARVTSVVVVPMPALATRFASFCWTSSLDGTIAYWDFAESKLIRKIAVGLPVFSMVIPNLANLEIKSNEAPSCPYAFISVEVAGKADLKKALCGQIKVYNLTSALPVGGLLAETRKPEAITLSRSGEYIGIKNKRKLHIWKLPLKHFKNSYIKKIKLHHTKNLSALAFHPTERTVAGGDVTGRILIWRGFGSQKFSVIPNSKLKTRDNEERPGVRGDDDADLSSTWHWHPAEVNFLSFSSDGTYLYSGGKEGVLVVWQLDTGKKKFLPRLGSPLLYFVHSSDPSLSCISCANNQVHLLKMPSMGILKSISGIKPPCSFPEDYEESYTKFTFDHAGGLVALRTEKFSVQLFSLLDDVEISQVQISERNYQPVDDVTVVLTHLAISSDGFNMGTVEVRLPEEEIGRLVCLKFWMRASSQPGDYSLSTLIYEPHSDEGISSLAFRPSHNMAVTSSYAGDFKIWVYKSGIHQKYQRFHKTGWRCKAVGSYKKKPMTSAAFSPDGTVLAVAAESIVTLWDPDVNTLIAVIGETLGPIVNLVFTGNPMFLVTVSQSPKQQLAIWDVTRLSMSWSYKLSTEAVAITEDGSHFAALVLMPYNYGTSQDQDGLILLFDVENPAPLATWLVKKAKGGGLAFLKANASLHGVKATEARLSKVLAFINGEHEYVIFDPFSNDMRSIRKSVQASHVSDEDTEPYGYSAIYGDLPMLNGKSDAVPLISSTPSGRPWETIFSETSHALPPLTKLCSAFLESLLERRTSTNA